MASTFVNDLRLNEMATGDQSGSWGTVTNTNLELIAEAFSFGTESITTNADTHTTTIADGATDPGRSMFLKYTGTLDSACTITIAPNTVSKLWFIENGTSGSQNIIIKQGSGATITIPPGDTKAIYSDGAGSGGKMVDAFASLSVVDLNVSGAVDIDGAVQIDATLSVGVDDTGYDVKFFGATASAYMLWDASADDLILGGAAGLSVNSASVFNGGFTANYESTITVDDNTDNLTLTSTDADASAGPKLNLFRNSASPADGDFLGNVKFNGRNDASQTVLYAEIEVYAMDVSDGAEDGLYNLNVRTSGANTSYMQIRGELGQIVFNESSADVDFRVESNNETHALFVQGSDGFVGIGQDTPTQALDVAGGGRFVRTTNLSNVILETTDTDANAGPVLDLYRNSGSPAANDDLGRINFQGENDADETITYSQIFSQIVAAGDGVESGRYRIATMLAGDFSSRMDMTASETVFNDSSKDLDFRVESDNDTTAFFVEGSTGNIGMSTSDPDSHTPQTHNPDTRSFVSHNGLGSQVVMSRSDTAVVSGDYIGGYFFKTNDNSTNKFGGMIATADDATGNGNLEFFPVNSTYDSSTTAEGSMQLDDADDLYIRAGGIKVGRSHGNVYTSTEEAITISHTGDGSNDTSTQIVARDGTGGNQVFRHTRRGTVKSEIEENGDFLSATDSYGSTSDGRLKENIVDSGSQWDDIKALQIKKYSFIDAELDAPNMIGVIAQDLLAAGMSGLVKKKFKTNADDEPILDADGNHDYIYTVKGSVMQMKALKALQEAMAKIEVLEAKVAALET